MSLLPYELLYISLLGLLAITGLEDKRSYSIHLFYLIIFSAIFLIFYTYFFLSTPAYAVQFLLAGLLISGLAYAVLHRQLRPADHWLLAMANISFPFVSIPALLLSFGWSLRNKEKHHAFAWDLFRAFLVVSVAEGIGLLVLIK